MAAAARPHRLAQGFDRRRGQVAELHAQRDPAGDDVRRVRLDLEPADGTDLAALAVGGDLAHGEHQLRRGDQRVLPAVHRGGAGVVGHALDDDVVAVDGDDALDDADRHAGPIERPALFDVQLHVGVPGAARPHRRLDPRRIAADAADRVAPPQPVPLLIEDAGLQVAGDDAAARRAGAEGGALLVGPQHHLQRMTGGDASGAHGLEDVQRGQCPEIAVEVAAAGHRVDVRAEEDGRRIGRPALDPDEHVAGGIEHAA